MKSLVLFTDTRCAEFPFGVLPEELPQHFQESNVRRLEVNARTAHFSIQNVNPVRIGPGKHSHIQLLDCRAELAIDGDKLVVLDDTNVYVNGKKKNTGTYAFVLGDSVWAGSTLITLHDGYIACTGMKYKSSLNISTQTPVPYEEFPDYKRSPRIIKREPTDSVDLTAPPQKAEKKKGGLAKVILPPLGMMAIMIVMAVVMQRGIMVLMSGGALALTLVFSVTTFFSDRKDGKKKEKKRVDDYNNYLLQRRKELHGLHQAQRESLLYHNLSPKEIEHEVLSFSSRLFERAANDSDFLTLSLGSSTTTASYKLKYPSEASTSDDPLAKEMMELATSYQTLSDMPTVIDLKNAHLGLVGEKAYIHRQLTSILMQLCFFQSYHDMEVVVLVEEADRPKFEWTRWYPHCRVKSINVLGLVSAENQRDQVLGNIAQILKARRLKQQEEKKDSRYLPHYVFIADNPKLVINHSIMEYLQAPDTSLGFSLIYTTNIRANLPENIRTVCQLDGGDHGTLLMNEGRLLNRPIILPCVEGIELETIARKLAPIKHSQGISTQIPESVTFFELFGVKRPEDFPVLNLWEKNACFKSLAVPLGLRGKDDIVDLNLHEKAHGPHGLVAGTTGSGKSEIIQSYILSLAINFHPHEVGFLLIDYKGGGMANLFNNLPHLLGTITNLDGSESMRALASIRSENARRQRVFNDNGVNNINNYHKLFRAGEATLPLPHLFIISDEFAELKKEQPDFMSELVSVARIGRSLGVHLILATQKPSGVVDDQIWSNSKFKLALKVANEGDSNEVLKTPDAARITQPGRAYLQVGNNEIYELFQSAWSGASYSEEVVEKGFDSRVYLLNELGQGKLLNEDLSAVDKSQDSKLTQLDVVVNYVQEIFQTLNAVEVEKPWLPPLPDQLVTPHIAVGHDVGQIADYDLKTAIGMADIPEQQDQVEYAHDFFDDGNFAVFGASGFGKSTTMMNIALNLACKNSPSLLQYFILDFGNSGLIQLKSLPQTADYISLDDTEKLDKLVKLLAEEMKTRKHLFAGENAINFKMYNEVAQERIPAMLVFIDNYDVIREASPELEEFLVKLTRDGTGVGIYTIVTASRFNAMRYAVANNFKNKIAQFMFDPMDLTAAVGRCAYQLPEVRGRALAKMQEVHVTQCYLPVEYENDITYAKRIGEVVSAIADNNSAAQATGVRVLGDIVTLMDMLPFFKPMEHQGLLGFDTESTEPLYLDLSIPIHLIVGAASTGKTNILRILLQQFRGLPGFVADSRAGDLQECEEWEEITYMGSRSHTDAFYEALKAEVDRRQQDFEDMGGRIREFVATQMPALVLVDDADNFVELCSAKAKDFEQLLPTAIEMGITFVVTTTPSKMRGYDPITKILKDMQAGIALGNPTDQSLLPIMPPRGFKPVPDIGFWYKRGDFKQMKLPFVKSLDIA